jgi:3-dehydroquinate synthase
MMSEAARRTVRVDLGSRSYDVVVGAGAIGEVGEAVRALGDPGPVILVTNPTVAAIYATGVRDSLEASGLTASQVEIPDGERHKTFSAVERIHEAALGFGADRSAVVVALGGGVVGDVAGFAAATLFRGVRVVMLPTTLLAQVDSSVGGKTGVNRPEGKNLVGAFHQPSVVLADTATLSTLPPREYRAGMAEVVKYGIIRDPELFALLEERAASLGEADADALVEIVARSVAIKARVVEADEHEGGLRRVLNHGHTIGHAIEKVTRYERYLHGEAVAIGMVCAARMSENLGYSEAAATARIESLLKSFGLETAIPDDLDRRAIVDAVAFDKKVRRDKVAFVVNEGIGKSSWCEIEPGELAAVI